MAAEADSSRLATAACASFRIFFISDQDAGKKKKFAGEFSLF
jgi:hypothetical protein